LIAVCLLEVVAEDLLVLPQPPRGLALQPAAKALMQLRSQFLGHGAIGGVADEDVPEAVGLLFWELRALRADEVSALERSKPPLQLRTRLLRYQFRHRPQVERLALHRGTLQHMALPSALRADH
jgi:hypothetical protein